jgi:FlgD Ig-like domain
VDLRYTVPALGACLLVGIVPGCICHWTPPDTHSEPADTTGSGHTTVYSMATMWPGETRRIALPPVGRVTVPSQFVLRANRSLVFNPAPGRAYVSSLRGMVAPTPAQLPAPAMAVTAAASAANAVITALFPGPPRECWIHIDSLAVPGDTIELRYTLTSMTKSPRRVRWTWPIIIVAPQSLLSRSAGGARANVEARIIKHPPKQTTVSAYPNPFNPRTTVEYTQSVRGRGALRIYDMRGRLVATLADRELEPGVYRAGWDGTDREGRRLSSGVYFVRFTSLEKAVVCKLVLLK